MRFGRYNGLNERKDGVLYRWDWMLLNKSGIQFFSLKIMDFKENSYTEIMEVCMKL